MSCILPVYKKLDFKVKKAEGQYIWDESGKKYVDFLSGVSVTNIGHRSEPVTGAIKGMLDSYIHISNLFEEKNQETLARELVNRTMPSKVFFSNSGAEANECAIKTARKYFAGEKFEVLSFMNSFHGRTLATLAATGQAKYKNGLGPMPAEFHHAEYNFLASVEDKITNKTCAIMAEIIQAEGGINVAKKDFIKGLRKICDDNNILLIIDEIQTGIGRTCKFSAYEHYDIEPDIITLGKALGGGLPLGATVIKENIADCMEKGDHGSTFGGNPLACAAGLATVKAIDDALLDSASRMSELLFNGLNSLASKYSEHIKEVRGLGLLAGIELGFKGAELVDKLMEAGYITNCIQNKVVRFLPPLTIQQHDIDGLIVALEEYFKERG